MKKAIFAIYVVSILLFSGLAKADADLLLPHDDFGSVQKAIVTSVYPDLNNLALRITGTVSNPNVETPVPVVIQDSNDPRILTIVMIAKPFEGTSIFLVKAYDSTFSLPQLLADANIQFNEHADYLVRVSGSNFEMVVSGSDLLRYYPLPLPNQPATF